MANRIKKKPMPYAKGDRGSPSGGRAAMSRHNAHLEGIYRNRYMVQGITSLIGCEVEVELQSGSVYEGILHTVSPQMDFAVELACIKARPGESISKSVSTLVVKWEDIARITTTEGIITDQKEIFKMDSEIATNLNGHSEKKELEPFEFDDTSPLKVLNDDGDKGWAVEDMFITNEEKFNVGSSFNPDMTEYTTPLTLTGADQRRIEIAERKAREIESHSNCDTDKRGEEEEEEEQTEEKLFSSVIRPSTQQEEPKSMALPTECAKEEVILVNGGGEETEEKKEEEVEQSDAAPPEQEQQEQEQQQQQQPAIEPVASVEAKIEPVKNDSKKEVVRSFKLNPDAQEFKPTLSPIVSNTTSSSATTSSSSSPSLSHSSRPQRYNQLKGSGPRQPRPPLFSPQDQTPLYGAGFIAAAAANNTAAIRMMHGQPAGPLTSPTGLMIRPNYGSQIIGHQSGQFYSIPSSLPGTPTPAHSITSLNQAALLHTAGTPHGIGLAATPQGHNLVYVPVPYAQPFPTSPLGAAASGAIASSGATGLLTYPQPQTGGK